MKILVGSENPVKLEAVKDAFTKYFGDIEVVGIGVESHVPAQPVNDETYIGAQSRAIHLLHSNNAKQYTF